MAWLCTDCCAAVETMLAAVPALVEQLEVAVSKQAKIGGSGKAGKGIGARAVANQLGRGRHP
jgi:hypothetical protein